MDFGSNEGVDRISDLPNDVLGYILSFLPTKNAVATSVLSTSWKKVWTFVATLDFDARLHGGFDSVVNINVFPESEITFRNFVDRVMLLNEYTRFQKFRLIYECHYGAAPIRTWLQVGISRGIVELELDFCFSVQTQTIMLPRSLFMSCTLSVLKLSRMPLIVPSFVSFPVLKVLEIRGVVYLDDKCTKNLLSGCHVLEELVIEETTREKPRVIDISIPTLKKISFSYKFVIDIAVDCPYKFVINAPNLEYFHVKGRISDNFVVKNLGALINVHLDLRQIGALPDNYILHQQHIFNLLKGIANAKFLTLSQDIIQLLCAADLDLPRFFNLTTLALGVGVDICWIRLVIEFIKYSPDMEVLTLNNKQGILWDMNELRKRPAQPMPGYLLSQLKQILVEELYSKFLPEAGGSLVRGVNVLKRLRMSCQCPVMLRSQIGHIS